MDADQIREWDTLLREHLSQFDDCFARKDTRAHLPVHVRGQLSNLKRKSCEPIALEAGVPVRTLQEFLSQLPWSEDGMRNRVQQIVAREHTAGETIAYHQPRNATARTSHVKATKRRLRNHGIRLEHPLVGPIVKAA